MKIWANDIYRDRLGVIIFLIFAFLFTSCRDEEVPEPPVFLGEFFSCYRDSVWDANKISNALIGTWQWEYIACLWPADQGPHTVVDSNLTIEFMTDSFLIVKQHNEIVQTSKWEIEEGDGNFFSIDYIPGIYQLYGRILICEDRVVFNDSFIDGCDNYFIRVQ